MNTIHFCFTCSAVALDGQAYLFTAPSGTGKSTHTRLWREVFGERAVMVNDDKPLIQVREDAIYVCGTPWNGKHNLDSNQKVPIKGICLLERGTVNHIETISAADGVSVFISPGLPAGRSGKTDPDDHSAQADGRTCIAVSDAV